MKNIKSVLAVVLSVAVLFAFCACNNTVENASVENPVTECSHDEMVEVTGVDICAPDGAKGATYSYIEADDGKIAQVVFEFAGNNFCYRASYTSEVKLIPEDASLEGIKTDIEECTNVAAKLAGMHHEWGQMATEEVQYAEAIMALNEGKAGFVGWLDVVPGVVYSLSVDDGATADLLLNTADKVFVPLQGEN